MVTSNSLLQEVEAMKHLIVDACSSVEIAERDGLTLEDMSVPEHALNSCGLVAASIINQVDFSAIGEGINATYTGIQSPAGNHFAILLSKEGLPEEMSVIVDFTASQFSENLPFPLVMDCWEWQVWTESHLGRIGNWYHSYEW